MSKNFLHPLTGSFAQPAAENPTAVMIEAAYRQMGLSWRYLNCEVFPTRLGDAVRGTRAMNWRGFNCSIPHKIAVIEHLDELGISARIIGAVNTVICGESGLVGENTDGKGFLHAFSKVATPVGTHAVILGAGGAARAIAVELALAGATKITIVNRDRSRGDALANLVNQHTSAAGDYHPWDKPFRIPEEVNAVINATSVGLFPNVDQMPEIDLSTLRRDIVVADVVPNPPLTRFLKSASGRGCRILDGLEMLVNQGVLAIKYWTGLDADPEHMRLTLLKLGL